MFSKLSRLEFAEYKRSDLFVSFLAAGEVEKVELVPQFQGKQTEVGETSFSR
jgi:hypothetical protein